MNTRLLFSTPKRFNPISWLVRKLSGSTASHAAFVYFDTDWQADMVMEAHELGFRLIPFEHFEKKNTMIATFVPKTPIEDGVQAVALEYLGTVYDYGGLFGGVFLLLGRFLKRKWHNPLASSKAVFCSEALVIAMQKSKYPGSEKLEARDTTPQDLLEFLKAEGTVRAV